MIDKKMLVRLIIILLTLCFSIFTFAETIVLKSGRTVEGKIIEKTDEYVKIDFYGVILTHYLDEIERIIEEGSLGGIMSEDSKYLGKRDGHAVKKDGFSIEDFWQRKGEKIAVSLESSTDPRTSTIAIKEKVYVNKKYGFSIEEPLGWVRKENTPLPNGGMALVLYSKRDGIYPAIGITADSIVPFPDVRTVMDFTQKMAGQFEDAKIPIIEGPMHTTLVNREATKMKAQYSGYYKGEKVYILWYQVMKDNFVFTFSLTDIESSFGENRLIFERMLKGFKFAHPDSLMPAAQGVELIKAAARGERQRITQLLSEGVDINVKDDPEGFTPLIAATVGGKKDIIELLLAKGANVDLGDRLGMTPLMYAASLGYKDIIELLLAHGADVDIKDSGGHTALMRAEESGNKNPEIIKLLKDARKK